MNQDEGIWGRAASGLSVLVAGMLACGTAVAQPVPLPAGSVETHVDPEEAGAYELPLAAFTDQEQPTRRIEGLVSRHAYRFPLDRGETFAVFTALRQALAEDGFIPLFQCSDTLCGGFDFRFGIEVLPPPEMEVDLNEFHFASFERIAPDPAHLSLLVSRSAQAGFIQIVEILPQSEDGLDLEEIEEPVAETSVSLPPSDWSTGLEASGRAVLEGVNFETGQARLTEESGPVIEALAEFLRDNPELAFLIVGHSDNTGSLEANIALSRNRAEAVRQALIADHGIEAGRLSAAGAGFLAPRAPNATEEGQALNRRVEIVLR